MQLNIKEYFLYFVFSGILPCRHIQLNLGTCREKNSSGIRGQIKVFQFKNWAKGEKISSKLHYLPV